VEVTPRRPANMVRPPVGRVGCAVAVPRFGFIRCPPRGTTTLEAAFGWRRLWVTLLLGGAALQRCDQLVIDEGFSPSLLRRFYGRFNPPRHRVPGSQRRRNSLRPPTSAMVEVVPLRKQLQHLAYPEQAWTIRFRAGGHSPRRASSHRRQADAGLIPNLRNRRFGHGIRPAFLAWGTRS